LKKLLLRIIIPLFCRPFEPAEYIAFIGLLLPAEEILLYSKILFKFPVPAVDVENSITPAEAEFTEPCMLQ